MNRLLLISGLTAALGLQALAGTAPPTPGGGVHTAQSLRLPMSFELNTGRFGPRVRFLSRSAGATLYLTDSGVTMALPGRPLAARAAGAQIGDRQAHTPGHVLRMTLANSRKPVSVAGLQKLPGYVNYLIGTDRSKWRTRVPTYRQVIYRGVYAGTDLVYYGNSGHLEYDFIVKPGADPGKIQLAFEGASSLRVAANGDLIAGTSVGDVSLQRPYAYQTVGGRRVQVACGYSLAPGSRQVAIRTAHYDTSRPLVVDPSLSFVTGLLPASTSDGLTAVAVDKDNRIYISGNAFSPDLPVTPGAMQSSLAGQDDAYIAKLTPNGVTVLYCTYFGGDREDFPTTMGLDQSGCVFIAGLTTSATFPTTPGAFQKSLNGGSDGFVAKVNSTGTVLLSATLLGGDNHDKIEAVAVDSEGLAVVCGVTYGSFPVTEGAHHSGLGGRAFVTKVAGDAKSLVWSATFGGSQSTSAKALALGTDDTVTFVGQTTSPDMPVTGKAISSELGTGTGADAYIARLDSSGSTLLYSTYLGMTDSDEANSVAQDADGMIYVAGQTVGSAHDFPVTQGAAQGPLSYGDASGFACKIGPATGTLVFSTLVHGASYGNASHIRLTSDGRPVVIGNADAGFPTTPDAALRFGRDSREHTETLALLTDTGGYDYATFLLSDFWANLTCAAPGCGGSVIIGGTTLGSNGAYRPMLVKLTRESVDIAPTLTVNNVNTKPGDNVELGAFLSYYGDYVASKSISFLIDGAQVGGATTDANGKATYTYAVPADTAAGPHTITASFAGDNTLKPATGTGTLTVKGKPTDFYFQYMDAQIGRTARLMAKLESNYVLLAGKTVVLSVDDVALATVTTNADGQAEAYYAAPSGSSGSHTFKATFAGDAVYEGCAGSTSFYTSKGYANIDMPDAKGNQGDTVNLTATLTGMDDTALTGRTITFANDDGTLGTAVTGSDGVATLAFTIPLDTPSGAMDIYATMDEEADYYSADTQAVLKIACKETTLALTVPASIVIGSYQEMSAKLTETLSGEPVTGQTIFFSMGESYIGRATTDAKGVAVLGYAVSDYFSAGTTSVNGYYDGRGAWDATSGHAPTELVNGAKVGASGCSASGKRLDRVRFYCYLYATSNPKVMLAGKAVRISVDGTEIITIQTDKTGLAATNWQIPASIEPGSHALTYEFAGDNHYGAITLTKTLTVYNRADMYVGSNPDGSPGRYVTLYAYLYDRSTGAPYAGQNLRFQVDTGTYGWWSAGAADTDANGKATIQYWVSSDLTPGEHAIKVVFNGDPALPTATGYGKLVVNDRVVTVLYVRSFYSAVPGARVALYCYLYGKVERAMLSGKSVTFSVDGVTVGSGRTSPSGYCSVPYTVPSSQGTHIITVTFSGDTDCKPCSEIGYLVVP